MGKKRSKDGSKTGYVGIEVDEELIHFADALHDKVDELKDVSIDGNKIRFMSRELLIVNPYNLDEHVRMQPSLLAYWTGKEAKVSAVLRDLKNDFEAWEMKTYRVMYLMLVKEFGSSGGVPTISDVKAAMHSKRGKEWKRRTQEISKWEASYGLVKSFREAITQKGFALQSYVKMTVSEMSSNDSV